MTRRTPYVNSAPPRCPECKTDLSVHVDGRAVHQTGCARGAASAQRRADLWERLHAAAELGRRERAARDERTAARQPAAAPVVALSDEARRERYRLAGQKAAATRRERATAARGKAA